mmetsp:Transcript_6341/g.10758  ORF Transcript_6341/g.10758 Transcript_6341/m.10758 type:complete len:372 (+) Transcript_6341:10-1125(+)
MLNHRSVRGPRKVFGLTHLSKRFFYKSKLWPSALEATKDIKDGDKLLVAGFGICGIPLNLVRAVKQHNPRELTIVSNTCNIDNFALGEVLRNGQIKKMISSYVGENKTFERLYLNGEIELEFVPQGTLVEKMRAGGCGIPAFYTKTGVGTLIQEGGFPTKYNLGGKGVAIRSEPKNVQVFDGVKYVQERAITGDFSLIRAKRADEKGNVQFNKVARNFNPDVAMAGKICIVEAEEIVPVGSMDPDHIHLPSVYVHRVVKVEDPTKKIEFEKIRSDEDTASKDQEEISEGKLRIVKRVAREFKDGMYVNLGIGTPTICSNYIPEGVKITLQSENGVLGLGPFPTKDELDPDMINAGKQSATVMKGGSFFSSS